MHMHNQFRQLQYIYVSYCSKADNILNILEEAMIYGLLAPDRGGYMV